MPPVRNYIKYNDSTLLTVIGEELIKGNHCKGVLIEVFPEDGDQRSRFDESIRGWTGILATPGMSSCVLAWLSI